MQSANKIVKLVLDPFCVRQFDPKSSASQIIGVTQEEFLQNINNLYNPENLKPGYSDFCKHIFVENFTNTPSNAVKIDENNKQFIQTAYEARSKNEYPVLRRFIHKQHVLENKAKFLDIILYSKQQIQSENESKGTTDPNNAEEYEWGIISVKAQDVDFETPMDPITIMRNALGKEYGGSGIPIDPKKYEESINYWSEHVIVK